jgi:single-strand DNA-binding protein
MAGSVNKATLMGHLGADPETVSTSGDTQIVKFRMATSERWKDKSTGEQKERTEWHNVVIFNEHLGRIAAQYLRKGSLVYVEGQVQTRKWQDKDGNDRYSTEIVLQRYRGELTMIGNRNDNAGGDYASAPPPQDSGQDTSQGASQAAPSAPPMRSDDTDDDIPF